LSCSDLLPSLFFQHPTTLFAPTRCCPINLGLSFVFVFFGSTTFWRFFPRLPFPFFFDEHPMKMKTFGTLFCASFPPFRCCLPFRYRTTFRVFVSIPFPKKLFFFSPSFSRSFSFFTRPNPYDPHFLLSPLHACPINLGLSFVLVFFFDPPLFGGFSFLFFFLSTRSKLQLVVSFFAHYSPPACCCPFFVIGQLFGIFEFIEFFLIEFFSHLFFFHACFSLTLFCVVFPPVLP